MKSWQRNKIRSILALSGGACALPFVDAGCWVHRSGSVTGLGRAGGMLIGWARSRQVQVGDRFLTEVVLMRVPSTVRSSIWVPLVAIVVLLLAGCGASAPTTSTPQRDLP